MNDQEYIVPLSALNKILNKSKYEVGDTIRIDDKFDTIVTLIQGSQVWFEDNDRKKSYFLHNDDPMLQLIKKAVKAKTIFGQGLFIRKDDFGKDCCIGDKIEVIRPEMEIPEDTWEGSKITIVPEMTFTGTLVLLKSKGVMLRCDRHHHFTGYIKVPLTNRSRNIWKWRKL